MDLLTRPTLLLVVWSTVGVDVRVNSQNYYLPWPYYYQTRSPSSPSTPSPTEASLQDLYSELFRKPGGGARERQPTTLTALALESCAARARAQIPADVLRVLRNPNLTRYGYSFGNTGTTTTRLGAHAQTVHNLLLESPTARDAICTAHALRNRTGISRLAWLRGVISATISRPDMASLVQPLEDLSSPNGAPSGICRMLNGSASSSITYTYSPENRLWYWREDLALNLNHWNWHRINGFDEEDGDSSLSQMRTRADSRKSELFYFFHHGILARYHAERLANGLAPVEGMFLRAGQPPPSPYHAISVQQAQNLMEMIANRVVIDKNGRTIQLDSKTGIDVLGQVLGLEASNGTAPDMEAATVLRDPIFYAYYAPIDEVFDQYKRTLVPYTPEGGEWPLHWPQIEVTAVRVETQDQLSLGSNKLITFWHYPSMDSDEDAGSDSTLRCVRQLLDHKPFTYHIEINRRTDTGAAAGAFINGWGWAQKATVHIFMAPRFDADGERYSMDDQRKLFFPMDIFTVKLRPGQNLIERRSEDSTLTTQMQMAQTQTHVCSACGWPHHLLLPKGTSKGQVFDLLVMVTNDKSNDNSFPATTTSTTGTLCRPASIYCGTHRGGDRAGNARLMNYPFDRLPYSVAVTGGLSNTFNNAQFQFWPSFQYSNDNNRTYGNGGGGSGLRMVKDLDEYTEDVSNMGTAQVSITHVDNSILHPPLLPFHAAWVG